MDKGKALTLSSDNAQRFLNAISAADNAPEQVGIGVLGQKTLHAVVKLYLEPDTACHEQHVGRYVADVLRDGHIYEVQTAGIGKLSAKLSTLLPEYSVTVVFPIAHSRRIVWIEQSTGELSRGRKSPKTGRYSDVLDELYSIRSFLTHPNFKLLLLLIDLTEYRNLDGWNTSRKKGSTRSERIPNSLYDELLLASSEDYTALVPENLGDSFTAAEFSRALGKNAYHSWFALKTLISLGTVIPVEKKGRSIIYTVKEN